MWNDEAISVQEELMLKELALQYAAENDGISPDCYEELCYDAMTYDEFVGYIKEALRLHCCIVDVVE